MDSKKQRIVVKVGSNVLTRADGKPNITNMSALVDQIASLHKEGVEVVLVTSGAVACGRGEISPAHELDSVEARQLFSSIGQIKLINLYSQLFAEYGIVVGQVLTQKDNFSSPESFGNQRGCILTMLLNNVLPIVNENDTVSLTELMFTDNDELSGLMASMVDADRLIILSNIDGIYTGDPADPASKVIPVVLPGEDVSKYIRAKSSTTGRGGMKTKYSVAFNAAAQGIQVSIANGNRRNVLLDLIHDPASLPHTTFLPSSRNSESPSSRNSE